MIQLFIYIYVLFHSLFHDGLSLDIEYSSLCYVVGPCCLCILYIIVYICRSQNLNPSLPQPLPPWQRCVDELNLRLGYGVAKEIRASPDGCGTAVGLKVWGLCLLLNTGPRGISHGQVQENFLHSSLCQKVSKVGAHTP